MSTATGADVAALRRSWRIKILVSTWVAYVGFYFCRKAFYALKDAISDDLGFSATDLGIVGAVYLTAYAVGQFISGGIGQRRGARLLFMTGLLTTIAANIGFAFASGVASYSLLMAVNGLAQATGWSACIGTLGHWTERHERGTIMGFWATCYQLGGVLGTSWAAMWLEFQGWRGAFLAASAMTSLAWLCVFLWQRNDPSDVGLERIAEPDHAAPVGAPVQEGKAAVWTRDLIVTIVLIGVCYFGIKFVRYWVWSWSSFFLSNSYHLTRHSAGYYSTLFDVGGAAGVILAGICSDRFFGGRRVLLSLMMLCGMMAGCIGLYLFATESAAVFMVGLFVIGFMLFGPDALLSGAAAMDVGSARTAVAAAGIINGIGSLGSVVQEVVVGPMYDSDRNMGPIFAILIAASMLSVTALAAVLWRNARGRSDL